MKIHADDCPTACNGHVLTGLADKCDYEGCVYHCTHRKHDCACTAQADLAELVAAAEVCCQMLTHRDLMNARIHLQEPRLSPLQVSLDAALKPFREEKPK